ncbi:MAG: hypothetical protein AMXMBFR58_28300 [Phycisphaerae bacterium]
MGDARNIALSLAHVSPFERLAVFHQGLTAILESGRRIESSEALAALESHYGAADSGKGSRLRIASEEKPSHWIAKLTDGTGLALMRAAIDRERRNLQAENAKLIEHGTSGGVRVSLLDDRRDEVKAAELRAIFERRLRNAKALNHDALRRFLNGGGWPNSNTGRTCRSQLKRLLDGLEFEMGRALGKSRKKANRPAKAKKPRPPSQP